MIKLVLASSVTSDRRNTVQRYSYSLHGHYFVNLWGQYRYMFGVSERLQNGVQYKFKNRRKNAFEKNTGTGTTETMI
jgi:hypothetical protein